MLALHRRHDLESLVHGHRLEVGLASPVVLECGQVAGCLLGLRLLLLHSVEVVDVGLAVLLLVCRHLLLVAVLHNQASKHRSFLLVRILLEIDHRLVGHLVLSHRLLARVGAF